MSADPQETKKKMTPKQFALPAAVLAASGFVLWFSNRHSLILCPVYAITGVPCPTCGMSRAWFRFFDGEVADAFAWHPLFLLVLFVPLLFFLYRRKDGTIRKWIKNLGIVLLILLIAVWLWRMLLYFPSTPPLVWNENAPLRILWRFFTAT